MEHVSHHRCVAVAAKRKSQRHRGKAKAAVSLGVLRADFLSYRAAPSLNRRSEL